MPNLATITGMITVGISVVTFFQQNRFSRNSVKVVLVKEGRWTLFVVGI